MRCSQYSASDDFCAMMFDIGGFAKTLCQETGWGEGTRRTILLFCKCDAWINHFFHILSSLAYHSALSCSPTIQYVTPIFRLFAFESTTGDEKETKEQYLQKQYVAMHSLSVWWCSTKDCRGVSMPNIIYSTKTT